MTLRDPIEAAYEAARAACEFIAKLAEHNRQAAGSGDDTARRRARRLTLDAIESLLARARSAPQMAATWGPQGLLVYYLSKASEALGGPQGRGLAEIAAQALESGEGRQDSQSGTGAGHPRLLGGTDAGYLAYAIALTKLHIDAGLLQSNTTQPQHNPTGIVENYFRRIIEAYMEGRGISFHRFLRSLEALARLLTLYLSPLTAEEASGSSDDANILNTIEQYCPKREGSA